MGILMSRRIICYLEDRQKNQHPSSSSSLRFSLWSQLGSGLILKKKKMLPLGSFYLFLLAVMNHSDLLLSAVALFLF